MYNNYVSLHTHTEQSLLDSCTNYKLYVDKCVELNQTAIAFTEHGNTYNWVEKKMYCDEKGIKFIFGVECYLTEKHSIDKADRVRDNYHTILLAKNYDGVREINRLIYMSTQSDHMYYKPRISFDEFLGISDNVIKISACLASPLNGYRIGKHSDDRLFNHYDYYEIQPHNNNEQSEYNIWLYEMSKKYNKPLVATGDYHSSSDYKAECRSVFQLGGGAEFSSDDTYDLTYKSYNELVNAFRVQNSLPSHVYTEAIYDTNIVADSIENFKLNKDFKYPVLYGDKDEQVLKDTIMDKYKHKLANNIISQKDTDEYNRNIAEEMRVFNKVGMTGFILFMSELITWCWENDIPIGFCRGSVGGSTVAYLTDIIDVNPIIWKTVFSRFCNEDRVEIGDIDVDVAPDQRQLVYDYIIERFGKENTAYILTSGTVVDKGTIDIIGKAFKIKWNRERGLDDENNDKNPYALDIIKQIKQEYDTDPYSTKEKHPEIFYYFDGVLNTVRSQSKHPAGILASPVNLIDEYGCFNKDGENIICINMEECHEVSLVKYDILGLNNIQIIRDTCEYANIPYPRSHEIDWNDKNVWEHMCDSPTGIFQFESQFASQCLKKMNPKQINDMSLANAALRPSGESYRERLFSGEINKNPSKEIDELLKDNNGFLCISENEKVHTLNGLKEIKNVQINDLVYTTKGLNKVNNIFNNGIRDVYKLSTKYTNLTCTENHKILTENGWKEYKDIEIGESIAHHTGTLSNETYDYKKLKLIGWTLGDGICSGNNIGFINQNEDVVNSYKETIEQIWEELTVYIKDVKSRVNKFPLYRCNVKWKHICHNYDKPIHHYFDEIGLRKVFAKDKFIPDFIFSLNEECLLMFLGAYTDTDSYLSNNTINYKTSSEKLKNGIVEVLRLLGYLSCVTENQGAYNIGVLGGNELISKLYNYSIKIRAKIPNPLPIRTYAMGKISTKIIYEWLKENHITISKVQKKTGVNLYYAKYTTIETILKIGSVFNIEPPLLISNNIKYAPVTKKYFVGTNQVYDLEIDSVHNFIANGIVVHNCFQEDTIKFLQGICGLSGSEADNIRRAIGRKQIDRLQQALPRILDGYCEKANKPREVAEQEAKQFLQIIEDSSNYQFGYNHSTGYSMIGYLCAWLRYYYPLEFCTSLLNNAGSDEDLINATNLCLSYGYKIYPPKYGKSKAEFTMDKENGIIYKGISSIKDLNVEVANNLYHSAQNKYENFIELLKDKKALCFNKTHIEKLIKIDYFSEFGDMNELLMTVEVYNQFGGRKTIAKPCKYDIEGCYEKETEKQYRGIDNAKLCNKVLSQIEMPKSTICDRIRNQIVIMGYSTEIIPNALMNYFAVQSIDINKYGTPFFKLYRLYDGQSVEVKGNKNYYKNFKVNIGDLIECIFKTKAKRILVDEKWIESGEYESILSAYSKVNEEELRG